MASSRWKRFAFFEKNTYSLPPEVLEDLIPAGGGGGSSPDTAGDYGNRRLARAGEYGVGYNDSVSLAVTTAALPLNSKPGINADRSSGVRSVGGRRGVESEDAIRALGAMWSSLEACTSPGIATSATTDGEEQEQQQQAVPTIPMPSQTQVTQQDKIETVPASTTTATDGLVLVFVASRDTELVHCFDVTARCNPPAVAVGAGASAVAAQDLDDLGGWAGYFAPFPKTQTGSDPQSTNARHNAPSSSSDASVVGVSACRSERGHRAVFLACISRNQLKVWEDPHLHLSCRRPLATPRSELSPDAHFWSLPGNWNMANDGEWRAVDAVPGLVAAGTSAGSVLVFVFASGRRLLRPYLKIPSPPGTGTEVVSVKISSSATPTSAGGGDSNSNNKASIFVAYRRDTSLAAVSSSGAGAQQQQQQQQQQQPMSAAGICCYDLPMPNPSSHATLSAPSARHDLDGRYVSSSSLVDAHCSNRRGGGTAVCGLQVTVARPDGLYSYSQTERTGVAPIDGQKIAICLIPPPIPAERAREVGPDGDEDNDNGNSDQVGSGYALVAATDAKSGRDAVDIYDATNKLVAFHLLLSPGHRAVRAGGITTFPTHCSDGSVRGGRSSAVVLTSGGSLVTLTEKVTAEKISLLVQKNLYSAAIVVAYADPSYEAAAITGLYRRYAEHLYRKGDFGGAIDQYIHTIGSLESSHVIFRYLDAPKIPLLVKYLERLRSRGLATPVHNELLRTCYLKLNDTEAAEAIAASGAHSTSINKASLASILSNLSTNPKEALATICSLDAQQAAQVLVVHGASLARVLPRETAGVVVSLCIGTYSPRALADAALRDAADLNAMIDSTAADASDRPRACPPYPVHLFASAFIEHPKMLRLILAHCNRNRCPLTPSLRRTLLELTLAEWNHAKRSGDTEAEKLRHKEAIAALTDSHSREIGDYDALVIVQLAGFEDGELLLYERLQMVPMLLERYAKDGSEKSRRQMLAMCNTDPEILADVLGHFVAIASEKLNEQHDGQLPDDGSEADEAEEILEDIQEALTLARRQGVLPPVRIARILAGEGTGQFSSDSTSTEDHKLRRTVPLSVALEYVGTILEESRKEITRLKTEVEEYNQLCNTMETEIDSLLRASHALPPLPESSSSSKLSPRLNIDDLFSKVKVDESEKTDVVPDQPREAFWRDMNHAEESFDTIARFFAKGVIH